MPQYKGERHSDIGSQAQGEINNKEKIMDGSMVPAKERPPSRQCEGQVGPYKDNPDEGGWVGGWVGSPSN